MESCLYKFSFQLLVPIPNHLRVRAFWIWFGKSFFRSVEWVGGVQNETPFQNEKAQTPIFLIREVIFSVNRVGGWGSKRNTRSKRIILEIWGFQPLACFTEWAHKIHLSSRNPFGSQIGNSYYSHRVFEKLMFRVIQSQTHESSREIENLFPWWSSHFFPVFTDFWGPSLECSFSALRRSWELCFGYVLGLVGGKRFLMKKSDTPSLGVGEAGRIQEEVDFLTKSPISATWTGFSLILMFWDLQNAPMDF